MTGGWALLLALGGCAAGPAVFTAPDHVNLPLAPGLTLRVLTGGLRIATPVATIEPRPRGVLGADIIAEF